MLFINSEDKLSKSLRNLLLWYSFSDSCDKFIFHWQCHHNSIVK